MKKRLPAYNLTEILVVLSIIGILLTIALPRLGKTREVASRITCAKEMESIAFSLELFYTSYSRYPETLNDLVSEGYLGKKGLLDPWGQQYFYEKTGERVFVLKSSGPDGQANNEDDVHYEN